MSETDGHYTGTTEQGLPISFDVVVGGAALTNLTFLARASCSPSDEIALVDEPITITGFFPIGLAGHFGDTVAGTEIEAFIAGTVTPSGNARGTLRVALVIPCGKANIEYSTGEVSWTARSEPGSHAAL